MSRVKVIFAPAHAIEFGQDRLRDVAHLRRRAVRIERDLGVEPPGLARGSAVRGRSDKRVCVGSSPAVGGPPAGAGRLRGLGELRLREIGANKQRIGTQVDLDQAP